MRKIGFLSFLFATALLQGQEIRDACDTETSSLRYQTFAGLLFLQPNGSNLYYAAQAVPQNPALADPLLEANWFEHEISPAYHPAFELGGKICFTEMGMNLVLDYERLSGTDKKHFSVPNNVSMVGPLFDIGPDAEIYIIAKGKAVFRFDMADVFLEKQFYNQHRWMMDFTIGASFARIKQYMKTSYFSGSGTVGRVIKTPSLFTGAGIVSGIAFNFELFKHFQLLGKSSVSLLMGQLQNKATYRSYSPSISAVGNPQPNTERSHVPNRTQLVPGLEEKLGCSYAFPYSRGAVSLEAGYLFQIFINAVQTYDIDTIVTVGLPFPTTDGYYAQGFQRTLSNFILTGPYLDLNVSF